MTPVVVILVACIGAVIGTVIAPHFSPFAGVALTAIGGLAGAVAGLSLWIKLLRRRPELQQALAVTPEGIPKAEAVDALIHPDHSTERKD